MSFEEAATAAAVEIAMGDSLGEEEKRRQDKTRVERGE